MVNKSYSDEKVMVVARGEIFKNGVWHGIRTDGFEKYLRIINIHHQFLPRSLVEEDPSWQQIIPYLVFNYRNQIFLMRRKKNHSDKRIANNYSIGIGGHVNQGDLGDKGYKGEKRDGGIMGWAKREFGEEVDYQGGYQTKFLGLINDDSNDIGSVHLGLVIKVLGDSDQIKIKDEHKSGQLVVVDHLAKYYQQMETWSKIVYDFLKGDRGNMGLKGSKVLSGILPDWVIEEYIEKGLIQISPKDANWRRNIDQVSIDFHLGGNLKLFRAGAYRFIDTRRGLPGDAMEEVNLAEGDPFILEPGAFAIASTREVLKLPADVLGRLEGKSSLARLGILVHSTAARFDPGWNGAPVLELGNLGPKPAILYCGMPICAFTFEKIAAPVKMPYAGSRSDRYSGSKTAVASKIHKAVRKKNG